MRSWGGIAEGDAGIAHQAAPFGALDRASSKKRSELFFVHLSQPLEPWEEKRLFFGSFGGEGKQLWGLGFRGLWENSWLKFGSLCHGGATIPRANVLADVAAEDMMAHGFAQAFGNTSAELNR